MNSQELQICSFEQAKRLKKAGFNWECDKLYVGKQCVRAGMEYFPLDRDVDTYSNWNDEGYQWNDGVEKEWISAPTVALALQFIENKFGIIGTIRYDDEYDLFLYVYQRKGMQGSDVWFANYYNNRQACESALLDELLNILEKEQ